MSVNSQSDHKNVDTVEFSEMYNCTSYASTAMFKSNRCQDFVDRGYLFEFLGFTVVQMRVRCQVTGRLVANILRQCGGLIFRG